MTDDLGWVGTTRRSDYIFWLGLGIGFIAASLYATFMTGTSSRPLVSVAGIGLTWLDVLTLLGVPVGGIIVLMAEANARSRYYIGQDEIVKQTILPFYSSEERIRTEDIQGAHWGDSTINSTAGTVELYKEVDGSSDMRLTYLGRLDEVVEFLKEHVDDLIFVKKGGSGGAAGGAAAAGAA